MVDFLDRWKVGLSRTRKVAFGRIVHFLGTSEIGDNTWEELEATLIQADLGIDTTHEVIDSIKKRVT